MKRTVTTLEQIRLRALRALSAELGPVRLVRFLQQFETGGGDYAAERLGWLDAVTVDDLALEMRDKRNPASTEE